MPLVTNNGVNLNYEVIGKGPALVLQHGLTANLDRWHANGCVDALRDHFQLILLDARGHGNSDKPHSPDDYAWDVRASDVICVANKIGLRQFSFWGYSMGAVYAYWLAHFYPDRIHRLVIGGIDPYRFEGRNHFGAIDGSDPGAFIRQFELALGVSFPMDTVNRILENDIKALAASVNAPTQSGVLLAEIPAKLKHPCLLYCGSEDTHFNGAQAASAEIQHATFVSLRNMTHMMASFNKESILPGILDFLAE